MATTKAIHDTTRATIVYEGLQHGGRQKYVALLVDNCYF